MSTQSADPDTLLVTRLRAGEIPTDLLEELVSDLTGYIRCYHKTFQSEADDIASEAVIEAYDSIESFRGDSAFFSWVVAIVNHLVARRHKKRQREQLLQWEDLPEGQVEQSAIQTWREEARDDRQLFLWDIEAALLTLNQTQQQVFILRVQEQLPSKEVAVRLGISDENVRQTLLRTCRLLRQKLKEKGWESLDGAGVRDLRRVYEKAVITYTTPLSQRTVTTQGVET